MDSRDIPPQPPSSLQQPPGMLMNLYRNPNAISLMGPTSTSQSIHHRFLNPQSQTLHHQQQQQQQMDQKTLESLGFGDGSSSSPQPMRFGIDQSSNQSPNQQQVKKKRGRPRKYTPDGGIALGLTPTSPLLPNSYGGGGDEGGPGDGGGVYDNSADPPAKRNRGRPPGSSKKQLDALGGTAGVGFTPHVIEVKTGEDIASKVMAFLDQGQRTICILSASGAVCRVTIHQESHPIRAITYEGQFEIITLSGTFLNDEVNGSTNKSGSLRVALAAHDGKIVGGSVAGPLVAATPVQVILGSFVADPKKPKPSSGNNVWGQNPEPASAPANMLNFGSASQGPSSESSEENESGSPSMHRDTNNGIYGAQQQHQQQQALHPHQMQMYHLWPTNNGQ